MYSKNPHPLFKGLSKRPEKSSRGALWHPGISIARFKSATGYLKHGNLRSLSFQQVQLQSCSSAGQLLRARIGLFLYPLFHSPPSPPSPPSPLSKLIGRSPFPIISHSRPLSFLSTVYRSLLHCCMCVLSTLCAPRRFCLFRARVLFQALYFCLVCSFGVFARAVRSGCSLLPVRRLHLLSRSSFSVSPISLTLNQSLSPSHSCPITHRYSVFFMNELCQPLLVCCCFLLILFRAVEDFRRRPTSVPK